MCVLSNGQEKLGISSKTVCGCGIVYDSLELYTVSLELYTVCFLSKIMACKFVVFLRGRVRCVGCPTDKKTRFRPKLWVVVVG